jgi:uridine kinase
VIGVVGGSGSGKTNDYAAYTRAARTERIESRDVVRVDGILLFADARLRRLIDIKIYVDVAEDVRFVRRRSFTAVNSER